MKRFKLLENISYLAPVLMLLVGSPLLAQDVVPDAAPPDTEAVPTEQSVEAESAVQSRDDAAPSATSDVSTSDLLAMFNEQQRQLDEQAELIEEQRQLLTSLQSQESDNSQTQSETIANQNQQIDDQRRTIVSMQTQIDQITQATTDQLSDEDIQLRARLETLESSIQASQDAANTAFDENSFPNSTMIPGTNAAMRFGGFVKMNIVDTFDPLGTTDRFIASTIPVPQQSQAPRTTMTVSQSRLNWDLRDRTELGVMRGYVEGDFAGDGDTFRLRHAFGQFRDLLAGKTWSAFMNVEASPEELDFEGINGRVNVRQPQIRYFPTIGENWDLVVSLEEPNPEVTGGDAISRWPDAIASVRRTWPDSWQLKSGVVLRQITAKWDDDPTGETNDQDLGWGITVSGERSSRFWNDNGLDKFMFQVNVGKGIGHYINDLEAIGGEDAVFSPTGELEILPIFAGYVAYQHWWKEDMRSTLNFSWVDVENLAFEPPDAYKRTFRSAVNFIWSPIPRIDIGGELIWGQRENKDGQSATALQIQLSTKYRF